MTMASTRSGYHSLGTIFRGVEPAYFAKGRWQRFGPQRQCVVGNQALLRLGECELDWRVLMREPEGAEQRDRGVSTYRRRCYLTLPLTTEVSRRWW